MAHLPPTISINNQGIPILEINNASAQARISLFGGHILSFCPKHDSRERLWVSNNAIMDGSKAIRGGIPVCWPWFGNHQEKQFSSHGFVRSRMWNCIEAKDENNETFIALTPVSSEGQGFDGHASISLLIQIGKQLSIQLCTKNIGQIPFSFTCALHSYFNIQNINQVEIMGLSGAYADKPSNFSIKQTPRVYHISEETDRVHLNPVDKVSILENQILTEVNSMGHDSIVVWNPWQEISRSLEDMTDDAYQTMLCIETAITQGQVLQPNSSHIMQQVIS